MCVPRAACALAASDPAEYLRAELLGTAVLDPRQAASGLLATYCHLHKDVFLVPTLRCVADALQSPGAGADAVVARSGALSVLSVLSSVLPWAAPAVRAQLEPLVAQHVVPGMDAADAVLRSLSCTVFAKYCAAVPWRDGAALAAACARLVARVADPSPVVAAHALLGLRHAVDAPPGLAAVAAHAGAVFDAYFAFLDRTDLELDDLVDSFEYVVQGLDAQIAPHAERICARVAAALAPALATLAAGSSDESNDSGNGSDSGSDSSGSYDTAAAAKASRCLRTLQALVASVRDIPDVLARLAPAVVAAAQRVCALPAGAAHDLLFDACKAAETLLASAAPAVPADALLAQLCACVQRRPAAVHDARTALRLLVARAGAALDAAPAALDTLFGALGAVLASDACCASVQHLVSGCKVLVYAVLAAPAPQHPRVAYYLPALVQLACTRLANSSSASALVLPPLSCAALVKVVAACLVQNAPAVLAALGSGLWPAFHAQLRAQRHRLALPDDKKTVLLALAAVVRTPRAALPPAVAAALPAVVADMLALLYDYEHQQDMLAKTLEIAQLQTEAAEQHVEWTTLAPPTIAEDRFSAPFWQYNSSSSSSDGGSSGDGRGDDGAAAVASSLPPPTTAESEGVVERAAQMENEYFDEDEFDCDDTDDLVAMDNEDEEYLESPLDGVQPVAVCVDAVTALADGSPEGKALCAALPPPLQQQVAYWMSYLAALRAASPSPPPSAFLACL